MDDERIEHALKLGPVDEPAYQRGMRARIRAADHATPEGQATGSAGKAPTLAPPTRINVGRRAGARTAARSRTATLAQLAAVLAIVVAAGSVTLPGIVGRLSPKPDMLDRLRATGSIRMLVPEGAPQTVVKGAVRIGFDIDVANAVAGEMTLEPSVMPVGATADVPASAWDVSVGMHDLGTSTASQPYAYWPAWLATTAGSGLTTIDSIARRPICVVGSSVGERWHQQLPSSSSGPPVVRAADDDECLAALAEGRVDALVTSTLFDDELASRGLVAVGSQPVGYEPRVLRVSATGEDATALVAEIDRAIDGLRTSGRLAELSRQSFGGRDLTEAHP